MSKFTKKVVPLSDIKANQQNPRIISESKLKKLINSLLVFPKMMSLRPITVDGDMFVLGGNMRQTALGRIAQMKPKELREHLATLPEYQSMTDAEQQDAEKFWTKFLRKPQVEAQVADGLTDDERQQFIIKDNVSYGDWDYDELQMWDEARLESWGLDMTLPDFGESGGGIFSPTEGRIPPETETGKLSELKFVDCYYTPEQKPDITLGDCVDLDLFHKKVKAIEESSLSDEQKAVMRLFAYRFIKIDFENVANYYAFNATDEEKRIIERLRCVLVDGALDGFFEDGMLRVNEHFDQETQNDEEGND